MSGESNVPENAAKNTHNVVADLLFENGDCKVILDIPCGAGAFTKRLLERGVEAHSADCANSIRVEDARFRIADMNAELPYKSGKFDAVVCIDGLEHVERPFGFIRECRRITRGGGILIISTPNTSALRSRWRWLLTGFHNKCKTPLDEENPTPSHHINMMSFPEIRYLLHTSGYRIRSIRANRCKIISWVYAALLPLAYLATRWALYREEKGKEQRERNREIRGQMFALPVLFGETLIVEAIRGE